MKQSFFAKKLVDKYSYINPKYANTNQMAWDISEIINDMRSGYEGDKDELCNYLEPYVEKIRKILAPITVEFTITPRGYPVCIPDSIDRYYEDDLLDELTSYYEKK